MLFVRPIAPQFGIGLAPPQPAVPIAGLFFAGHLPGNFGLGFPARVRKPLLVEDNTVFLADFGEPITIDGTPAGDAIFGEPYVADGVGSIGFSASGPRVLMPFANLPERDASDATDPVLELDDRKGYTFRNGTPKPFRYLVRQVEPDGTGWCSLQLAVHPDQTTQ